MKKLIYIVEDNEDIREILDIFLSDMGLEVKAFEDVATFKICMNGRVPDLYLLDINLPDGDGLELAEVLKKQDITKDIPIMVMSAHMKSYSSKNHSTYNEFVEKPFDFDYLYGRILYYIPA